LRGEQSTENTAKTIGNAQEKDLKISSNLKKKPEKSIQDLGYALEIQKTILRNQKRYQADIIYKPSFNHLCNPQVLLETQSHL